MGRPGRARPGRDRDPADHEPDAHVRPPPRRRRPRRPLPARPAQAARELGRDATTSGESAVADAKGALRPEPRPRARTARRGSCSARSPARSRRARSRTRSSCSSIRPSSRSAGARRRASCTSRTAPRSRSSRPTAAASRPTTGPGQLVCYPIFDLNRHGRDVKRYCRDLEEALIRTLAKLGVEGERIDGLTGVWLTRPPRKIAIDRDPHLQLGDDARLRAERRPRPGAVHAVDHRLRARGRGVHDDRARARPAGHGRRGARARRSRRSREVFDLELEELPAERPRPLAPAGARAARRAR